MPVGVQVGPTSVLAAGVDPTSEHQFVFWRAANAHVYEAWFDGSWHGPSDTGWNSASPPSVAVSLAGHEYVFWRGANHHIYDASYIGSWSRARDLTRVYRWGRSGQSSSGVAAAVGWGNDHLFVISAEGDRLHAPVNTLRRCY